MISFTLLARNLRHRERSERGEDAVLLNTQWFTQCFKMRVVDWQANAWQIMLATS